MKRLSITLRVTLWYTLLLVIIMALVLGFMLAISQSVVDSNAQGRIRAIVDDNADEVEYDDGELDVDKDFDTFKDGVYSAIFDQNGLHIGGALPSGFAIDVPFADQNTQIVSSGGSRWVVYDHQVSFKKHAPVWVRGILSLDSASGVVNTVLTIAFVAFPLLIILAGLGGYWITRRAFRPVREINRSVDGIREGKDLSRRIELGDGHDEIHELADTYNRMLQRLEDSFEAEKQFASDVSHELRTPVSVILAQCEYALGTDTMDAEGRETLAVVQRQAERMSRLITHLLTITRLEQGTARAEFEDVDISMLIQTLYAEQRAMAPEGLTLAADIAPGITAKADIALITRLFDNLVQNAIKYSKAGGNVWITLSRQAGMVTLRVADDGIGIAQAEQARIWRRFYQVNPARTADEAGSMGLGLAIVRQIALLHHGEITVESTCGEGSAFTFTFPEG